LSSVIGSHFSGDIFSPVLLKPRSLIIPAYPCRPEAEKFFILPSCSSNSNVQSMTGEKRPAARRQKRALPE
jgi:hypothetical protein